MSKERKPSIHHGFSRALSLVFLGVAFSYLFIVILVMTPVVQTYITYAHHIDFFGNNKFDHPEDYGLAPGKTVNLKIQSADNTTLGAWFIFADSLHRQRPLLSVPHPAHSTKIPSALKRKPTILFLHGNTGTRALPIRVNVYTGLTARLDANVFAVDYRGFGDSEGHPTVEGVSMDVRAAWDYLMLQGAQPQDVLIVGHSLGTAIASLLAADLARDGIEPRGLVLMSPFSSLRTLMEEYYLFGFLPLMKPLTLVPLAPRALAWSLKHRFDTLTLVPFVQTSVLIAHGENDWDIPHTHSSALFDAFIDLLSPPENSLPRHGWDDFKVQKHLREHQRETLTRTTDIPGFGTLKEFTDHKKGGRRVAMLKTNAGKHDIGRLEGVQDVIGRMFGFY